MPEFVTVRHKSLKGADGKAAEARVAAAAVKRYADKGWSPVDAKNDAAKPAASGK